MEKGLLETRKMPSERQTWNVGYGKSLSMANLQVGCHWSVGERERDFEKRSLDLE